MTKYEIINLLKDCSIALHTPVLLINERNKLSYHFPDSFQKPPSVLRDLHRSYINESRKRPYTIQLFTDPYDQHLFLYPMEMEGKEYVLGVGPFLQQDVSRKRVKMSLVMNDLDSEFEEQFVQYYQQLPIWNQVQIHSVKRLLNQLFPNKENKVRYALEEEKVRNHYQAFTQSLHSYPEIVASKQHFIDLFKKGEAQALEEYQAHREKSLINPDVRTMKNHMIRLVSELGYICIEKGAQQDEINSLSDFYINFLESKVLLEDLKSLELNILQSFLDRIKKIDEHPYHSPLVERAQKYIFQNLTKELTLKGIAETLKVNPNYLSGVFTKEKGMSITHFINQQRIKEAKELLCITHHSLMDISMLLGYNSQSYFTRVFKSMEGIGPKEFRRKYQIEKS
ncbi:helix-turn-helix domain-containing protein [Halobacillus litoralis]|uniref:Helix-turn-helix domain-containing protein n=1 Tax=Halobacillus litoralis TaxID=45668 RepID=A0A845E2B2_9BACI|nr:helix-turn-helix domain-containing protein [Halobacillus litoralis]MYL49400.1 helix-turn-helix domain-containing protein [Halobacillus litoralis]